MVREVEEQMRRSHPLMVKRWRERWDFGKGGVGHHGAHCFNTEVSVRYKFSQLLSLFRSVPPFTVLRISSRFTFKPPQNHHNFAIEQDTEQRALRARY